MKPEPKGKILFVFSDPGGAKPCLSLMAGHDEANVLAVSDREHHFYKNFKNQVIIVNGQLNLIVDEFNPDLIFTGTSYTSNIEQRFVSIAKQKGITCWSFVDHWTSISERFRNSEGSLNLPDKVLVLDERARDIAINEGISIDKLLIIGNPYHSWLANWNSSLSRKDYFEKIGVHNESKKIILFAPDPLSNVDGKMIYGFDEYSASEKIVKLVEEAPKDLVKDWLILVKMHPNQKTASLMKIFSGNENFKLLPTDLDVNESIYFSIAVIGFFSSLLREADIMGKPIIRFLEACLTNDPFEGLNIGSIANEDNLIYKISNILSK
ncbi:hypothetical protein [Pedobacter cryoconitis]|uniref:hypothetical protein n=1 Tax=Pedobacter cryoconitis TaxID=188932 RepID=UPI000DB9B9CC|nr:hypothetical protein [Pedobacter cryoconitis]